MVTGFKKVMVMKDKMVTKKDRGTVPNWSRLRKQLNAMWDPGLDSRTGKGHERENR